MKNKIIAVIPADGFREVYKDTATGEHYETKIHSVIFWQDEDTDSVNITRVDACAMAEGYVILKLNNDAQNFVGVNDGLGKDSGKSIENK